MYITSLYKKGSYLDAGNYRGLTINSTLSKVFNSFLNSRLEKIVYSHNILNDKQFGFPRGARTTDHIFVLRTLAEKYLMHSNPEKLFACFVDFHKAYDSVWRQSLLYKLLR